MSSLALLRGGFCAGGIKQMQQVDPAYLFEFGDMARGIKRITGDMERVEVWGILNNARNAIQKCIYSSVYSPHFHGPLFASAQSVFQIIDNISSQLFPAEGAEFKSLTYWELNPLEVAYNKFETILISELQSISSYIVTKKGGFDIASMVDSGRSFFSTSLESKVPSAVEDVSQAMRCIAFEVPTAAGFHLHRANEAVLRVYWDHVTGGKPRPKQNNMGVYLDALNKINAGNESVRAHLKSIKDFHRNPLMHPEQTIESVDQAIDLMSAIRCAIGYMLKEIPDPPTASQVILGIDSAA